MDPPIRKISSTEPQPVGVPFQHACHPWPGVVYPQSTQHQLMKKVEMQAPQRQHKTLIIVNPTTGKNILEDLNDEEVLMGSSPLPSKLITGSLPLSELETIAVSPKHTVHHRLQRIIKRRIPPKGQNMDNTDEEKKKAIEMKLRYTYKEDQWSPVNPNGKKQYDRKFLLELQNSPLALIKPQPLPNLDIVRNGPRRKTFDTSGPEFSARYIKSVVISKNVPKVSNKTCDNGGWDSQEVEAELLRLFKHSSNEDIFTWIDGNIGSDACSSKCIRVLIKTSVESQLSICSDSASVLGNADFRSKMKHRLQVVRKFVKENEHLELQCVYALQAVCVAHQHHEGLLETLFNISYSTGVVSEEVFYKWLKSENPEEQEGKAKCVASVQNFMQWLGETVLKKRISLQVKKAEKCMKEQEIKDLEEKLKSLHASVVHLTKEISTLEREVLDRSEN